MTKEDFDYRFLKTFLGLGIILTLSQDPDETYQVKATRQDGKHAFGKDKDLALAIKQAIDSDNWSYHD